MFHFCVLFICSVMFSSVLFHPVPTFWPFSHVMFIVCITSNIKIYFSHKSSAEKFYIHGSARRNSRLKKSNEMQQYADIYLPLNYSTHFGCPSGPSTGVHKTVVAASGTDQ